MKLKALTIISVLLILVAGCGSNPSSKSSEKNAGSNKQASEITIKFAHSSAPGSARDAGAHKFKEVLEQETNGKVTVEIYPASQLGNPTEIVQGVQLGNIEMAISPTSFMGGFQPLITLLDIPFLLPNDKDALLKVQESDAMRSLLDKTEEVDVKTLGIWHTGYKQFTGPKPLATPDDFAGLKFRAMPSPVIFEQFRVLGASPTDLPFAETYNALQTGTIEGQENPLDTTYDMKLHEVQDYTTMTDHGVLDQLIIVNKAFYEGLDSSIKDAMQTAFEAGKKETGEKTYENIEKVRKEMEDAGMEFVEITDEQRKAFIEKVQPVREFYTKEYKEDGKALLEDIEKAIKEESN